MSRRDTAGASLFHTGVRQAVMNGWQGMEFEELTKKYAGGGHWLRHAPELRKEREKEDECRTECEISSASAHSPAPVSPVGRRGDDRQPSDAE